MRTTEGFKAKNKLGMECTWDRVAGFLFTQRAEMSDTTAMMVERQMDSLVERSPLHAAVPRAVIAWDVLRNWLPGMELVEMGPAMLGEVGDGEGEQ